MGRLGSAIAAAALLAGCNQEAAPADSAMTNTVADMPAAGELAEGNAVTANATDHGNTDHGNTDH